MERFEQRLDVLDLEAREGDAHIRRARRDHADAVLVEQLESYLLGGNARNLDAACRIIEGTARSMGITVDGGGAQ